jgi:CHRD domain-containing protein
MRHTLRWSMLALVPGMMLALHTAAADPGHHPPGPPPPPPGFRAHLKGFDEVPAVVSNGSGDFQATLNDAGDTISYTLSYADLNSAVTQSHIHVGQRFAAGAISVFLCSNLPNPPMGTQACPSAPATISGSFTAADVIGPDAQGVFANDFADLLRAIRSGNAYVNVHTDTSPAGEIRGQLRSHPPGPPPPPPPPHS